MVIFHSYVSLPEGSSRKLPEGTAIRCPPSAWMQLKKRPGFVATETWSHGLIRGRNSDEILQFTQVYTIPVHT